MVKRLLIILSAAVVIASVGVIISDHVVQDKFALTGMFNSSREMADWLLSFGHWAVLISIVVMIIQTIATPVPLFLVAGANGFIFGIAWGVVITLVGALLGSTVAFFMARFLARDFFTRRLSKYMPQVEEMSRKSGVRVVFLARLVPILPSSVISYAAGLSRMSFKRIRETARNYYLHGIGTQPGKSRGPVNKSYRANSTHKSADYIPEVQKDVQLL